jgi:hypothetical protein
MEEDGVQQRVAALPEEERVGREAVQGVREGEGTADGGIKV